MREPKITSARRDVKARWAQFVRGMLQHTGWSCGELAYRLGCSKASVSRWACEDPVRGTIPHAVAQKQLIQLARERGLLND